MADVKKIEQDIRDKVGEIAKVLNRGYDCEIRRESGGVRVIEVKKTVVAK